MSHFTVLVVGPDPTESLAPFHEFECTGQDDEFVQDIDVTEETREEWRQHTKHLLRHKATGEEVDAYDERFYRAVTPEEQEEWRPLGLGGNGRGLSWDSRKWSDGSYGPRIYDPGEEWEKVEVQGEKARSFLEYATEYTGKEQVLEGHEPDLAGDHKYGYTVVDSQGNVLKVVDRTNPNHKWDWYQVGGRWSGMYKLKPGRRGQLGNRSLLDLRTDDREENAADIFLKGDVDWEAMRAEKEAWATRKYRAAREILDRNPEFISWVTTLNNAFLAAGVVEPTKENDGWTDKHHEARDRARETYSNQTAMKALRAWYDSPDEAKRALAWDGLDDYVDAQLEDLVKEARDNAGVTHAVILEGKWYEVGEMGWWGMVADEKDSWPQEFSKLIDSLPDDTVLTLVDCHT